MPLRLDPPRWMAQPMVALMASLSLAACATSGPAPTPGGSAATELPPGSAPTFADLADLSIAADLVAVIIVDEQITVPAERAPGLPAGMARQYVEATTLNLLAAPGAMGESMTFVVDLPLDARGDTPKIEQRSFLVFGDPVPGQPGMVQLVSSSAMIPAGPMIEGRVREVLTQLASADALPEITGVRDVISVPGNLAGESETQMFVETGAGLPVSLSVIRRPSMAPRWGVSLGEIVNQEARPPEPETVAWYRFACFLPRQLPEDGFLQADGASRERAREDYSFVLSELGPCERRLGERRPGGS